MCIKNKEKDNIFYRNNVPISLLFSTSAYTFILVLLVYMFILYVYYALLCPV